MENLQIRDDLIESIEKDLLENPTKFIQIKSIVDKWQDSYLTNSGIEERDCDYDNSEETELDIQLNNIIESVSGKRSQYLLYKMCCLFQIHIEQFELDDYKQIWSVSLTHKATNAKVLFMDYKGRNLIETFTKQDECKKDLIELLEMLDDFDQIYYDYYYDSGTYLEKKEILEKPELETFKLIKVKSDFIVDSKLLMLKTSNYKNNPRIYMKEVSDKWENINENNLENIKFTNDTSKIIVWSTNINKLKLIEKDNIINNVHKDISHVISSKLLLYRLCCLLKCKFTTNKNNVWQCVIQHKESNIYLKIFDCNGVSNVHIGINDDLKQTKAKEKLFDKERLELITTLCSNKVAHPYGRIAGW
jgi:hypothetical protein